MNRKTPVSSAENRRAQIDAVGSSEPRNRCETWANPGEMARKTEESMYHYFKQKAMESTQERYRSAGLSQDIFLDNIEDIEIWADEYESKTGRRGIAQRHHRWIEKILDFKVIKIGRLQFEPLAEELTQYFPELEYEEDTLYLNVHIRKGRPFHRELCEASYEQAISFFANNPLFDSGPCKKVVFLCDSWLLNPRLRDLLVEGKSNILDFQSRFQILSESPLHSQIEERVFSEIGDIRKYPENTTLQVNLKHALLCKRKYGACRGFFVRDIG